MYQSKAGSDDEELLIGGKKKNPQGICLKLLGLVSGQEGVEKAAILEVHRLYYLVMAPLPTCLPIMESV